MNALPRLNLPVAIFGLYCLAIAIFVTGCQQENTGPIVPEPIPCGDASAVNLSRFSISSHLGPKVVEGRDTVLPGIVWAKGDSVLDFFGGKDIKVVFTIGRNLYLTTYTHGEPVVTLLSHADESVGGSIGSINSPLLSPDGKKIVFAGTTAGKPTFIQDAVPGGVPAWRTPLESRRIHVAADPHWHVEGNKTWIYFATLAGFVSYSDHCAQVLGNTYRIEVIDDTTMGQITATGIAGAYRGGISQDGLWAGTSYAQSALFNTTQDSTRILANGQQQCNASMNPYPTGSKHTDYMMVLAFGSVPYHSIDGRLLTEKQHENLWIYNKDDKIVWQAWSQPLGFLRWDKPEWSTHPDFATAVGVYTESSSTGDLVAVKIGDLANADEGELNQAVGYLKLASGGMTSESYSHLWVAP